MSSALIGTHSGSFHADEALGVWMLRRLDRFGGAGAKVVRSRDPEVLNQLPVLLDVGGVYDHNACFWPSAEKEAGGEPVDCHRTARACRYDHHQRGFNETFHELGFKTKLSSSGLIYRHWGRDVICQLHPHLGGCSTLVDAERRHGSPTHEHLEWVFKQQYNDMVHAIDAVDTGVEVCSEGGPAYADSTGLSARVAKMNVPWNDEGEGVISEMARFERASAMCGEDFTNSLDHLVLVELPARAIVEQALQERHSVHPSGQILRMPQGGVPWRNHLWDLEKVHGIVGELKFVTYPSGASAWKAKAVEIQGRPFVNRVSYPKPWRGLSNGELDQAMGFDGGVFVHVAGFLGGAKSYETMYRMVTKAIEVAGNRRLGQVPR